VRRDDAPAPIGVEHARFIAGDSLRALAALSIVVFHAALLVPASRGLGTGRDGFELVFGHLPGRILANGDVGVYLFFVLSGYLLSRPFIRAIVRVEPGPYAPSYLANRALRIIPAYWVVFTLTLILRGTAGSTLPQIAAAFAFAQTYVPSGAAAQLGQAWTLCVEAAFYVALPLTALVAALLLGRRFKPSSRLLTILAVVAIASAASVVVRATGVPTLNHLRQLPTTFFAFGPGIALAALELVLPDRLQAAPALRRRLPSLLLAAAALGALGYAGFAESAIAARAISASVASGCLVAALLVVQWSGRGCPSALDNRTMRWLGERSYGIYLLHGLVAFELFELTDVSSADAQFALSLALILAVTLPASAFLFRFVEAPALRFRRRWRRRDQRHIPGEARETSGLPR